MEGGGLRLGRAASPFQDLLILCLWWKFPSHYSTVCKSGSQEQTRVKAPDTRGIHQGLRYVAPGALVPVISALRMLIGSLICFIFFFFFVHLKGDFELQHRKAADLELIAVFTPSLPKMSQNPHSAFWSCCGPVLRYISISPWPLGRGCFVTQHPSHKQHSSRCITS